VKSCSLVKMLKNVLCENVKIMNVIYSDSDLVKFIYMADRYGYCDLMSKLINCIFTVYAMKNYEALACYSSYF